MAIWCHRSLKSFAANTESTSVIILCTLLSSRFVLHRDVKKKIKPHNNTFSLCWILEANSVGKNCHQEETRLASCRLLLLICNLCKFFVPCSSNVGFIWSFSCYLTGLFSGLLLSFYYCWWLARLREKLYNWELIYCKIINVHKILTIVIFLYPDV